MFIFTSKSSQSNKKKKTIYKYFPIQLLILTYINSIMTWILAWSVGQLVSFKYATPLKVEIKLFIYI